MLDAIIVVIADFNVVTRVIFDFDYFLLLLQVFFCMLSLFFYVWYWWCCCSCICYCCFDDFVSHANVAIVVIDKVLVIFVTVVVADAKFFIVVDDDFATVFVTVVVDANTVVANVAID